MGKLGYNAPMNQNTRTHSCMDKHACTQPRSHTHTLARTNIQKYAIPIAFPWQELFRESASMLRHTYIACLVSSEYEGMSVLVFVHTVTAPGIAHPAYVCSDVADGGHKDQ
jgi:hypothetical protein